MQALGSRLVTTFCRVVSIPRGRCPLIGWFAGCSVGSAAVRSSAPENPCPRYWPVVGAAGRLYGFGSVQPLAMPAMRYEVAAASGGFCSRIIREETFYSRLVRLLVQVSLNSRYSNTGYSLLLLAALDVC